MDFFNGRSALGVRGFCAGGGGGGSFGGVVDCKSYLTPADI
jgi:hypothetical protein